MLQSSPSGILNWNWNWNIYFFETNKYDGQRENNYEMFA